MATLPDTILTGTAYQNLNLATGIITGTPLIIQNKSTISAHIIVSPTQPLVTSKNGWLLQSGEFVTVENETDIVWAKSTSLGNAHISVQILT